MSNLHRTHHVVCVIGTLVSVDELPARDVFVTLKVLVAGYSFNHTASPGKIQGFTRQLPTCCSYVEEPLLISDTWRCFACIVITASPFRKRDTSAQDIVFWNINNSQRVRWNRLYPPERLNCHAMQCHAERLRKCCTWVIVRLPCQSK